MIALILYGCIGAVWGTYATIQQRKLDSQSGIIKYFACLILNWFFWPIPMFVILVSKLV